MSALTCPHCHHPFPAGRKLRLLGTPAPLRCQHCFGAACGCSGP